MRLLFQPLFGISAEQGRKGIRRRGEEKVLYSEEEGRNGISAEQGRRNGMVLVRRRSEEEKELWLYTFIYDE